MKLQNKKTGEIGDIAQTSADCIIVYYPIVDGVAINPQKRVIYNSLAQLNKEWQDYEEPKDAWYISIDGSIVKNRNVIGEFDYGLKSIGNYFDTKEEAEKAVEKLKAWKRLKDKGFFFSGRTSVKDNTVKIRARVGVPFCSIELSDDLDLLFGGEE